MTPGPQIMVSVRSEPGGQIAGRQSVAELFGNSSGLHSYGRLYREVAKE